MLGALAPTVPIFERSTELPVGVETAWQFHRDPTGLPAVMPNWLGVTLENVENAVEGPDGSALLDVGSRVTTTVRPLRIGPKRPWVSEVLECESTSDGAVLHDTQVDGPFERWDHVHRFAPAPTAAGDRRCIMTDRVDFELPGGRVGRLAGPFGSMGLHATFAYRHRKTAHLLADLAGTTQPASTLL